MKQLTKLIKQSFKTFYLGSEKEFKKFNNT